MSSFSPQTITRHRSLFLPVSERRNDRGVVDVMMLVARTRGVAISQMLGRNRGRADVAAARQLAMYLCHVGLGRSLTEVGRFFGRDRTTVAHACIQVEDMRDVPRIDAAITALEQEMEARGYLREDGGADNVAH
jgi:chromosomal replication initiation ATPase DnaA